MPTADLIMSYPPGSIGWLQERRVCSECGFARASRLMSDPYCAPPLIYCEPCIQAINDAREESDGSLLRDTCYDCGGSGRYDDVSQCPTCDGEGDLDA